MPHHPFFCPFCHVQQPLVLTARCSSCHKLLPQEETKKPTAEDIEAFQKWLIQRDAQRAVATKGVI
jgi:hypothetical protein